MFDACKSTGRIESKDVSTIDSYLVGAVLDQEDGIATLLITDGNGDELLYLTLTAAEGITSKPVMFPVPVLAPNGITVLLTPANGNGANATCTIYYAEQYFDGHKHV